MRGVWHAFARQTPQLVFKPLFWPKAHLWCKRLEQKRHARLFGRAVGLLLIAAPAGVDQVVPGSRPVLMLRHNVIHGRVRETHDSAAVGATAMISAVNACLAWRGNMRDEGLVDAEDDLRRDEHDLAGAAHLEQIGVGRNDGIGMAHQGNRSRQRDLAVDDDVVGKVRDSAYSCDHLEGPPFFRIFYGCWMLG